MRIQFIASSGGFALHRVLSWFTSCKIGFLLAIFAFALFSGVTTPTSARAQSSSDPVSQAVALPGTASDAEAATASLYGNLKGLAGWILLLAVVFSGTLAAFGSPKPAMGVAIAAVIVYGGVWIIGLIRDSLSQTTAAG